MKIQKDENSRWNRIALTIWSDKQFKEMTKILNDNVGFGRVNWSINKSVRSGLRRSQFYKSGITRTIKIRADYSEIDSLAMMLKIVEMSR